MRPGPKASSGARNASAGRLADDFRVWRQSSVTCLKAMPKEAVVVQVVVVVVVMVEEVKEVEEVEEMVMVVVVVVVVVVGGGGGCYPPLAPLLLPSSSPPFLTFVLSLFLAFCLFRSLRNRGGVCFRTFLAPCAPPASPLLNALPVHGSFAAAFAALGIVSTLGGASARGMKSNCQVRHEIELSLLRLGEQRRHCVL